MLGHFTRTALFLAGCAVATTVEASEPTAHDLPVFFFHGLLASSAHGANLKANLSTDARPFVPLTFCEGPCSAGEIKNQAALAFAQIRQIVGNDSRFDNGYSIVGHSQGSAIARLVI